MSQLRFSEVAEVVIKKLAGIQPGESVVIVADTATNPSIYQAYLAAAINANALATLVVEKERKITDLSPAPGVAGSLENADVILGLGRSLFTRSPSCQKAIANGARLLMTEPRGMEDYLVEGIVQVDYDALVENAQILANLLRGTSTCEIRSDLGTNITCEVQGRPIFVGDGMSLEPGEIDYYPGCQVTFAPVESSLYGKIVVDGSMSTLGLVKEPFTLQVEAGKVVAIEGGVDAQRYRRHLEEQADPKLFEICHYSFGINPRATLSGNIYEDERFMGCLDIGFGSQDPRWGGTVGTSPHHVDIVVASPEVLLDGKTVIANNDLNYSMGFRAM